MCLHTVLPREHLCAHTCEMIARTHSMNFVHIFAAKINFLWGFWALCIISNNIEFSILAWPDKSFIKLFPKIILRKLMCLFFSLSFIRAYYRKWRWRFRWCAPIDWCTRDRWPSRRRSDLRLAFWNFRCHLDWVCWLVRPICAALYESRIILFVHYLWHVKILRRVVRISPNPSLNVCCCDRPIHYGIQSIAIGNVHRCLAAIRWSEFDEKNMCITIFSVVTNKMRVSLHTLTVGTWKFCPAST